MLAQIFEHSGVSVLIGLVALYFAYRVMVQKDLKGVLGKNKPEPEDKEGFSRDTGRLLLFFAAGRKDQHTHDKYTCDQPLFFHFSVLS